MNYTLKPLSIFLAISAASGSMAASAECNPAIPTHTPTSQFVVLGDGATVHDQQTQLIWMRCSLGQTWNSASVSCDDKPTEASTYTWQNALSAAHEANFAENRTWRLPNKKELASIVDYRCVEPAINADVFPNVFAQSYWTSTPQTYASAFSAWAIAFNNGNFTNGTVESEYAVRLVRDSH